MQAEQVITEPIRLGKVSTYEYIILRRSILYDDIFWFLLLRPCQKNQPLLPDLSPR